MGLVCGWFPLSPGEFHELFFQMSFGGASDAFWGAFGGGFGRQNGAEIRISEPLFAHLFLNIFLLIFWLILEGSKARKSRSRLHGSAIFAKLAFSKKSANKFVGEVRFGSSNGLKLHQIRFGKPMFFRAQFLIDFHRILEAKWLPGPLKKIAKNRKNCNQSRSGTR